MCFPWRPALACLLLVALSQSAICDLQVSTFEQQLNQQLAQNKEWERTAREYERQLMSTAEDYHKAKNFLKAADYYRETLSISYEQWAIQESDLGGTRSLQPGTQKVKLSLNTPYTKKARERLANLDADIAAESSKQAREYVTKNMRAGETALREKNYAQAYALFQYVINYAPKLPDSAVASANMRKAQQRQRQILEEAQKPLQEIDAMIKGGKGAEAAAKLVEYRQQYYMLLAIAPALKQEFERLGGTPEMRRQGREQNVQKQIALGDAAMLRNDYVSAARFYRSAVMVAPETKAARMAADKLNQMIANPDVATSLKQSEHEAQCRELMLHARTMLRLKRYDEARADCRKILDMDPAPDWTERANAMLTDIDAATESSTTAANPVH